MAKENKTQLITFYSYKGGVGRTMALANAACQLANKHGLNIIVVDWDLEAPGLHYYFDFSDEDLHDQPGLLDYLEDFVKQVKKGTAGKAPNLEKDYLVKLKAEHREKIKFGSVQLMSCGRTNALYMSRVQSLNWERFYKQEYGFEIIETLKLKWREIADIVLIDARAGQSDIGTTPTIQVPDALVLLFTSNRQSLTGAIKIAKHLKNHPDRIKQGFPDLRITLVPSRISYVPELLDSWLKDFATPAYENLINEKIIDREDQPRGLQECILILDPAASFGETLPVLSSYSSELKNAYTNLAQILANLHAGHALWSIHRAATTQSFEPSDFDNLRYELNRAADRGDIEIAALRSFELGKLAIDQKKFDLSEELLRTALTHSRSKSDQIAEFAILHEFGRLYFFKENFDMAFRYFSDAIMLKDQIGKRSKEEGAVFYWIGKTLIKKNLLEDAWLSFNKALESAAITENSQDQRITLHQMANIRFRQNQLSEAMSLFEKALKISEQSGDIYSQAIILHQMGQIALKTKELEKSISFFHRALMLSREAGDMRNQTKNLYQIARLKLRQGFLDEASDLFEEALKLMGQANNMSEQDILRRKLKKLQHAKRRRDKVKKLDE